MVYRRSEAVKNSLKRIEYQNDNFKKWQEQVKAYITTNEVELSEGLAGQIKPLLTPEKTNLTVFNARLLELEHPYEAICEKFDEDTKEHLSKIERHVLAKEKEILARNKRLESFLADMRAVAVKEHQFAHKEKHTELYGEQPQ